MELHAKQFEAVKLCLDQTKRIASVTGPAGSGKTTTIKEVVAQLDKQGLRVGICAPTGKAARRITQATNLPAVTMHKMLEYPKPGERDPETGKVLKQGWPKRDYKNPLPYHVIIADEYAMVNRELDRNLIDAMRRGCRLLCFGDMFQLPPIEQHAEKVGDKSPFEKHLARVGGMVMLDHVFRQAEDAGILISANHIRMGRVPQRFDDFQFAFTDNHPNYLMKYIVNAQDAGVEFNTLENQIISPMRYSWIGTIPLNMKLQQFYNSHNLDDYYIELPRYTWDHNTVNVARGDKVVCTENTYDMRNYHDRYEKFNDEDIGMDSTFIPTPDHAIMLNGETGIVEDIFADGSLLIRLEDRTIYVPSTYEEYNYYSDNFHPLDPRKRIDLAYVLTTHKCQGSEYSRVIYCISGTRPFMLNRRNFYTGVTRARDHVMTICDQKALQYSLRPYVPLAPKHKKEIVEWTSST